MYTATFPVHIKFRIKRKAVPSCLLPRLPLRVLPRLRLWTQDQMSPFSWAGGTHSDVKSVGLTLAEVFFWDWRRGRRITKEMTYVWIIVHSCGGSLAAADEQTNIWLPCNNCFSTCNRSVEHTEVISLNTFALPVINSNLVPIVPRGGSVELLAATVFVLKVKGDVLTKYRWCYLSRAAECVGRSWPHENRGKGGGSGEIHSPSSCAFIRHGGLFFLSTPRCVKEIQRECVTVVRTRLYTYFLLLKEISWTVDGQ